MVPKFRLCPLVLNEKPLPPHTNPALCLELEGRTSITLLGLTSGSEERTEKSPKTPRTNCAQPETTQPRHSSGPDFKHIPPTIAFSMLPSRSPNTSPHCLLYPHTRHATIFGSFITYRGPVCTGGSAVTKMLSSASPSHFPVVDRDRPAGWLKGRESWGGVQGE